MTKISPSPRPTAKPGILDIAPYVAGKSQGTAGQRVVKLSSNETPLGPSPLAIQAYQQAAASLHRYPESGAATLVRAIAAVTRLPADNIVCGAGSDELIGLLIHAYAGLGDEVLMSEHGFLMYKIYAQSFGARVVTAKEKNLKTDVAAMLAAVTPQTKIVFIANPNNPTGSHLNAAEIKQLHEGLPSQVLLVVDEAYREYAFANDYEDATALVAQADNVVVLRTFSKIYGLSALRLGWAYAPAAVCDVLHRIRGPFNVSTPAIMAGVAAVEDIAFTRKTRDFNNEWLGWMREKINALGLTAYPSLANFVLVGFHDAAQADAANIALQEAGLIVREVKNYGLPQCLRISIGLDEDNKAVVATLKTFLKG